MAFHLQLAQDFKAQQRDIEASKQFRPCHKQGIVAKRSGDTQPQPKASSVAMAKGRTITIVEAVAALLITAEIALSIFGG